MCNATLLQELFPYLSTQQCCNVLSEADGDIDDAIDLALEISSSLVAETDGPIQWEVPNCTKDSILLARPEEDNESRSMPANCLSNTYPVSIQITLSKEGVPDDQVRYNICRVLEESGIRNCTIEQTRTCLQAAYEEQNVDVAVSGVLPACGLPIRESVEMFCRQFTSCSRANRSEVGGYQSTGCLCRLNCNCFQCLLLDYLPRYLNDSSQLGR
ncbi:hypothetical protein AB6A40_005564 [Gnathostoma spinigerum]|uniref:CUE domain-containing protein n=1 Tax=Gnathostoma spinigerum TaxID=75299 RepID=A0ABD6ERG7_9BILA